MNYTVDGADFTAANFEAVTTVQKADSLSSITVYVEDQFGDKSDWTSNAKFESLNKEVALVDQNTGTITPIKEGTADVRITIGDFSVVRPIQVVADSELATLNLEKASIEISDQVNQSVDVVIKDQYGSKFKPTTGSLTATIKSGSNIIGVTPATAALNGSFDTQAYTITPVSGKEGTATIEFAVGDVKTTLTVNVKKAGVIDSYAVEGFKATLDKNISNVEKNPADMTLKVFGVDANGVKTGTALVYAASSSPYTVELKGKDKDGIDISTTGLVTASSGNAKIAPTAVGTYTVTVKVGSLTVYNGAFVVVDTTVVVKPVVTVKNSKIEAENAVADIIAALGAKLEVKLGSDTLNYNGTPSAATDYKISKVSFVSDNSDLIASATNATNATTMSLKIGTATLVISKIEIAVGTGTPTTHTVDLNEIFTVTVTQKTPAAPATTFAFDGINKNKLMGATTAHEYSIDGGENWATITSVDESLASLLASITADKDIKVRVKAEGMVPVGAIQTLDVLAGPAAPTGVEGGVLKITGTTTAMEYSSDGNTWIDCSDAETIVTAGDYTVRLKATGLTLPGEPTTELTVAAS
ncbi:hypothetical protein [Desulfitobacterium chlororespirans]|uniref:Surface layer protein bacterial Ig-like domain-containing protein n=1 Tax=Desulfitobacterium chlororespirans DSM 11544 TaxID=1121395 RepID=A0A1M7U9A8_9FIRM|nr:hypothetical protein [Desulfitobacterium chlororespirans]SHN79508.1 hypothetical protein SAMN02745215_03215 [Desulfitobacterium chlororespirans DSM 11544]